MFLFSVSVFFFFNDTATTEIYTLSLHDALPILVCFERDSVQGKIQFVPRPKPLRPRPNPVPESQRGGPAFPALVSELRLPFHARPLPRARPFFNSSRCKLKGGSH